MSFTRWSLARLAGHQATKQGGGTFVSKERVRQILVEEQIAFQRTTTWKECPDPLKEAKLAGIEYLLEHERDQTVAFDEFGALAIKPEGGSCWAPATRPSHRPGSTCRELVVGDDIGMKHERRYG